MHPFAKDKPCSLERKVKLEAGKPHKLSVTVAAHDQGDWELRVMVERSRGQEVNGRATTASAGRRSPWTSANTPGRKSTLRVEGAANGWSYEFGYWGEVKVE